MCRFAIVTPGNSNAKLLSKFPKVMTMSGCENSSVGQGNSQHLPPTHHLLRSRNILVAVLKALLSWSQPCSLVLQCPGPCAWAATLAWCPWAWEPPEGWQQQPGCDTLSWLEEGLPAQKALPGCNTAARSSLGEMLGVAKDRGCPTATDSPSCPHTAGWTSPRDAQRHLHRLDQLCCQEGAVPLCPLAKQLGVLSAEAQQQILQHPGAPASSQPAAYTQEGLWCISGKMGELRSW